MESLSLYIHVPFCRSKCRYCSFNSYSGMGWLIPRYVDALAGEIRLRADSGSRVNTIYIGGGTPTLLTGEQLGEVLKACREAFDVAPESEITIEANPGTVGQTYLHQLTALGVNRLSLGVQSFDDIVLGELGRTHTAAEALEAYRMARDAGFENVNIDPFEDEDWDDEEFDYSEHEEIRNEFTWRSMKKKQGVLLKDLETDHIENIIKWVFRFSKSYPNPDSIIELMNNELSYRKDRNIK